MFNKHNLSIANIAEKGGGKPSVKGVLVEPTCTVATDGHRMMIVSAPDPRVEDYPVIEEKRPLTDFPPFTIPREAALNIAKQIPESKIPVLENVVVLSVKQEEGQPVSQVSLDVTDLETHQVFNTRTIESRFPNWRAVVEKLPERIIDSGWAMADAAFEIRKFADGVTETHDGVTQIVPALRDLASDIEASQKNVRTQVGVTVDVLLGVFKEFKSMGVKIVDLRIQDGNHAFRINGTINETGQSVTAVVMPCKTEMRTPPDLTKAKEEVPA